MRELLKYPDFNMQVMAEVANALTVLGETLPELFFCYTGEMQENAISDVLQQKNIPPILEQLYQLIGKKVSLSRLVELMRRHDVDVVSVLLIQPRAPAVFDITFEEVVEILNTMYKKETPTYQMIYCQELLQKSLLLSQIEKDLPATDDVRHLLKDVCAIENLARSLFEKGRQASEIIAF